MPAQCRARPSHPAHRSNSPRPVHSHHRYGTNAPLAQQDPAPTVHSRWRDSRWDRSPARVSSGPRAQGRAEEPLAAAGLDANGPLTRQSGINGPLAPRDRRRLQFTRASKARTGTTRPSGSKVAHSHKPAPRNHLRQQDRHQRPNRPARSATVHTREQGSRRDHSLAQGNSGPLAQVRSEGPLAPASPSIGGPRAVPYRRSIHADGPAPTDHSRHR